MPLWEGVLASFCAGVGVSLLNRFGLSQIKMPCERRQETASDDSSDDSGETAAASLASIHAEGVHFHGGAD